MRSNLDGAPRTPAEQALDAAHHAAVRALAAVATDHHPGVLHANPHQATRLALTAAWPHLRRHIAHDVATDRDTITTITTAGEAAILIALALVTEGRTLALLAAYATWRALGIGAGRWRQRCLRADVRARLRELEREQDPSEVPT